MIHQVDLIPVPWSTSVYRTRYSTGSFACAVREASHRSLIHTPPPPCRKATINIRVAGHRLAGDAMMAALTADFLLSSSSVPCTVIARRRREKVLHLIVRAIQHRRAARRENVSNMHIYWKRKALVFTNSKFVLQRRVLHPTRRHAAAIRRSGRRSIAPPTHQTICHYHDLPSVHF